MKYAADFRSIARESLRGKWLFAVAAVLSALQLHWLAHPVYIYFRDRKPVAESIYTNGDSSILP